MPAIHPATAEALRIAAIHGDFSKLDQDDCLAIMARLAELEDGRPPHSNPIAFEIALSRQQDYMQADVTARRGLVRARATARRTCIGPDRTEREAANLATEAAIRQATDQVLGAELAIAHATED